MPEIVSSIEEFSFMVILASKGIFNSSFSTSKVEFAKLLNFLLSILYIWAPFDIFPFILPIVTVFPEGREGKFLFLIISSETV